MPPPYGKPLNDHGAGCLGPARLAAWREGGERVPEVLGDALMSAVNWSEVLQKSLQKGVNVDGMLEEVGSLGLRIEPFSALQAERAARLWDQTRELGLSLGDRACLALALALDKSAPVLTADRAWGGLHIGLDIQLLR